MGCSANDWAFQKSDGVLYSGRPQGSKRGKKFPKWRCSLPLVIFRGSCCFVMTPTAEHLLPPCLLHRKAATFLCTPAVLGTRCRFQPPSVFPTRLRNDSRRSRSTLEKLHKRAEKCTATGNATFLFNISKHFTKIATSRSFLFKVTNAKIRRAPE